MKRNVYEILEEFKNATNNDERVYILQRGNKDNSSLKNILEGAFHPKVKFVFNSPVNYRKSDAPPGLGYTNLEKEFSKVYLFTEGSSRVDPKVTLNRKEQLLVQILEALEAKEAEVFMNMMLKNLNVPGLTKELVNKAFPNLIP